MFEELNKYLEGEGYTMRRGVSYFFDRDEFWNADWLNGHKTLKQRVIFQDRSYLNEPNWLKIEVLFVGYTEYETFYEGTIKDMEQFKMLYENMLKLKERW